MKRDLTKLPERLNGKVFVVPKFDTSKKNLAVPRLPLALAQVASYIVRAVHQSKTSGIKSMWNDLRTLQGIGSAVIEYGGRSVFSGPAGGVLTELLTNEVMQCPFPPSSTSSREQTVSGTSSMTPIGANAGNPRVLLAKPMQSATCEPSKRANKGRPAPRPTPF